MQKTGNYFFSIDIIIPSYRVNEDLIKTVVSLSRPEGYDINIYLVIDNPSATIPDSIIALANAKQISLLLNDNNRGVSESRNRGINASAGKWLLFLDDDITPEDDLLLKYAEKIQENPEAPGFAGCTMLPPPYNTTTCALDASGITQSFTFPCYQEQLIWAPTANLMLNRETLPEKLFDGELTASGEDIDLCVRISLLNKSRSISVPEAKVFHPWWNNGDMPTKKIFLYGVGGYQIARKIPMRQFTYVDFLNTTESMLTLLVLLPVFLTLSLGSIWMILVTIVLFSELVTNYVQLTVTRNSYSLVTAFKLAWIKNVREFGFLYESLRRREMFGFARRLDTSFNKPHPGWFRLNRWKILKMLIVISMVLAVAIKAKLIA